jgi:excisionase family DNA binding protein
MNAKPLLTETEVADLLGIIPRRVRRLARQGDIPCVRLPGDEIRFDESDLRDWLDSRKQPAGGEQ